MIGTQFLRFHLLVTFDRCCLLVSSKSDQPHIKHLFEPRSIAVIGASTNPSKIGYKVIDNIIASKYTGKIYPVNPRGGEILG